MHSGIYLQRIQPQARMWRFYSLEIRPTLFGQWALVRRWGRIGTEGQQKEIWFDKHITAAAMGEKLLEQKIRRGYMCYSNQLK